LFSCCFFPKKTKPIDVLNWMMNVLLIEKKKASRNQFQKSESDVLKSGQESRWKK